MRHLTKETARRLAKAGLPPEERNEAVRHLLTRCPQCARMTQNLVAGVREDLDSILDRLEARQQEIKEGIQQERLLAAHQWASLQNHSQAQRLALIDADPQMHTWGLYDAILEAARQAAVKKTGQAIEVADLALAVATSLDEGLYGEALIADYQAAAMAVRGNCKRVAKDFEGARADLETAWELLKKGTGDPLARADILRLRGSWNTDLGFCKEAEEIFARAINLYRRVANDSMVGLTMISQARAIDSHDPQRALLVLQEASGYIDPIKDPWAELCRRHNLGWCLNESGRPLEAERVLQDSRGLYREFRDPKIELQFQWLEGRIHQSLGNTQKAEEIFERTAADFLERGLPLECLLCSLDLARVLFVQGDRTRALQICKNLYHLFSFWGMPTEQMAVLLLLIALLKQR
jgi:tetratricopeptide (TPR) repeat protein